MKRKALIVLVVVALIAGGAAVWNASGGPSDQTSADKQLNTFAANATGTAAAAARITATIYRINKLQLDPTIFSSPVYASLVPHNESIPEEPVGRPDPFAPLYQDDVVSSPAGRAQGQGGLLNIGGGRTPVKASTSTTPAKKAP